MPERALPGFRDFYPAELAERSHITNAWREVARRFGFQEYDGPPLEPLELYTRKSGAEIVGQLYNFTDKGGREVALRPEMTPTFARMVATRANALRKPVRWFSTPQLFRYERQQKGRLREHFQFNVDIVGESDVTADAELAAICIETVRELGLTGADARLRFSDRRLLNALLEAMGVSDSQMPVVYAVVDKAEREPAELQRSRLLDAGISGQVADRLFELLSAARGGQPEALLHFAGEGNGSEMVRERVAELRRYLDYTHALGIGEWMQFDLSIVRGLAYYTGIVFELFDARGSHRAICGGGRYDGLLAALGDVDLPALGFGMGDVVLADILRERQLMPASDATLEYWVASESGDLALQVRQLGTMLRRAGHSVEYALKEQSLSRQLKSAVAAGARYAAIIRADAWTEGNVQIRDLQSGQETQVSLDSL